MKQVWVYFKFLVLLSIWVVIISFAIIHPDRALLLFKLWGFGMLPIVGVVVSLWLLIRIFALKMKNKPSSHENFDINTNF